jgi:hypothetical protein
VCDDHKGHHVAQMQGVFWQGSCLVAWGNGALCGYRPARAGGLRERQTPSVHDRTNHTQGNIQKFG